MQFDMLLACMALFAMVFLSGCALLGASAPLDQMSESEFATAEQKVFAAAALGSSEYVFQNPGKRDELIERIGVIEEYVNLEVIHGGYLNTLLESIREKEEYHSLYVALSVAFVLFGDYLGTVDMEDVIGQREHALLKAVVAGAKSGLGES
jgi:hypothetical protein